MTPTTDDPRLDPRMAALAASMVTTPQLDVTSREELLALVATLEAREQSRLAREMMDLLDDESVAPSDGLDISVHEFVSQPDGNVVKIRLTRPRGGTSLPCVYYLHGGAMATMSCFDGIYRAWARIIAAQGLAVAMVDFRNCVEPSSSSEVAPFPAGLHDCVSGLRWVHDKAEALGIDADRIVVAGESGGGNLTLATALFLAREGDIGLARGLFAMCPYLVGRYPDDRYPSTLENNGILLDLHNNRWLVGYGIEAFEAQDPLAWPAFAKEEDVVDFPPTLISVNECDPLRDEGIAFYRLLLRAGVSARCRQVMGTPHAAEVLAAVVPDISRDTANTLAHFTREVSA